MRFVVLALVFLNIAFLAWTKLIGEPAREPLPVEAGPPIPRLQLASEAGTRPVAPRCTSVGPFADQAVAERAVLWLRGERREPRLRTTRRDAGTGYWVMVDTPTLQQAARVSMRLKAGGVADVEVLPPAADATRAVVSLGTFADRAAADRRVADLRAYAVNPQVVEQPRAETLWWIDVDLGAGATPIDVNALERAVEGARGLVGETCPAIAPGTPSDGASSAPAAPAGTPPAPTAAPTPATAGRAEGPIAHG
jgi:hypothetical protein